MKRSILRFIALVLIASAMVVSCKKKKKETPQPVVECKDDAGRSYKFTYFGTQVWMTENLAYDVSASHCYNDIPDSCVKYGRLYTLAEAQSAAPDGWHVPTDAEWKTLELFLGMSQADVDHASSNPSDRGTAASAIRPGTAFNALYGGQYHSSFGYSGVGMLTYFWSTDMNYVRGVDNINVSIQRLGTTNFSSHSVRCVKD
jgi:uncharacterized protein (TIGR02145 family)